MKTYIDELVEKVSEATGLKSKETVKLYKRSISINGKNYRSYEDAEIFVFSEFDSLFPI